MVSLSIDYVSKIRKGFDLAEENMAKFPTPEWTQAFMDKLNHDAQYGEIARNWEGDIFLIMDPSGSLSSQVIMYFDLWHGKCRQAYVVDNLDAQKPAFTFKAPYDTMVRVMKGELHVMQALLTRKVHLEGNFTVLMRSVPMVLDFVRCAQEITDSIV